ncbi:uncharacterized protein LOC124919694 [Impatiens glandulifera]|uniref:uncharacterized protein LOC124919694 n=1 Tax=Impatiens glandulifera TaxID=253017 RepID=UPI001FB0AFFF|nr:uncharacterized protein LOC124919694 [Impatiens glandulifera]
MEDREKVQDFSSRVSTIINQIKSSGDEIKDKKVVEKVLFDHVAVAIEELKDLSKMIIYELIGSLLAHEQRINRSCTPSIDQAFKYKQEKNEDDAKFVKEDYDVMFVSLNSEEKSKSQWYLDSGASNHMTSNKDMFVELNSDITSTVVFGDGSYQDSKGKGTIVVPTLGDDLIYFGTNKAMVAEFKNQMMKEFEMTGLRLMKYFLGIQVKKSSIDDRKNTSGYIFCLGSNVISWSSRKQKYVSLSSAEAKYITSTDAACEARNFKGHEV